MPEPAAGQHSILRGLFEVYELDRAPAVGEGVAPPERALSIGCSRRSGSIDHSIEAPTSGRMHFNLILPCPSLSLHAPMRPRLVIASVAVASGISQQPVKCREPLDSPVVRRSLRGLNGPHWGVKRSRTGPSGFRSPLNSAHRTPVGCPPKLRTAAPTASVAVRGVGGELRGSRAERRWWRLHVPGLHQGSLPVAVHPRPPWHGRGQGFESPKLHVFFA